MRAPRDVYRARLQPTGVRQMPDAAPAVLFLAPVPRQREENCVDAERRVIVDKETSDTSTSDTYKASY